MSRYSREDFDEPVKDYDFSAMGDITSLIDQMSKIINKNFIKDYYTVAIDNYIKDGGFVEALDVKDNKWTEVDNIDDYYKARSLFK